MLLARPAPEGEADVIGGKADVEIEGLRSARERTSSRQAQKVRSMPVVGANHCITSGHDSVACSADRSTRKTRQDTAPVIRNELLALTVHELR